MPQLDIETSDIGIRFGPEGISKFQAQEILESVRDKLPFDVIMSLVLLHFKKSGTTWNGIDGSTLHFTPGAANGVILRVEEP